MEHAAAAPSAPAVAPAAAKAFFTAGERAVLVRTLSFLAQHPDVAEMVCESSGFDKPKVDSLATVFVTLTQAAGCWYPMWLALTKPCLGGERAPSAFSVAVLQSFLLQQSAEWVTRLLGPLFARLAATKLRRKRAMKEAELCEALEALMDILTSDEAMNTLPRPVRAVAGLLWSTSRNLGLPKETQLDIVADFYFQRVFYPVLLVPDQYELVDVHTPLSVLARQIVQGAAKCMVACIYQSDLSATPFACVNPLLKGLWSRAGAFVEKLVVDPSRRSWSEFTRMPATLEVPARNENDLGALLALLVSVDESKLGGAVFPSMLQDLGRVGHALQRRRAVAGVVDEEKAFMLRVDAVTFWLRDLDYGLMAEGTALRMCGEWLKKVNQLRAVLRISLNKRVHPSQWNDKIAELVTEADFSVFANFARVLKRNLPIIANSVDRSLENAIIAYKAEMGRDPLRDLVATLLHGRTLLTRLARVPASLDEAENVALKSAIDRAEHALEATDARPVECLEIVRVHQMQDSVVAGWNVFPRELAFGSGIVTETRKQLLAARVSVSQPQRCKSTKFAILCTDVLVLLDVSRKAAAEGASSAAEREAAFGSSNVFDRRPRPSVADRRAQRAPKTRSAAAPAQREEVLFRMVHAVPLAKCLVRWREDAHSFVLRDAGSETFEVSVMAAQQSEWKAAWLRLQQQQESLLEVPRDADVPPLLLRGATGPEANAASIATPSDAPTTTSRTSSSEEEVDEMEALMALGMYDTAVVRKDEAPNEADAAFGDVVGQVKRRDGKRKVDLLALFLPPPPPPLPASQLSESSCSLADTARTSGTDISALSTSAPASDDEDDESAPAVVAATPMSKARVRRPAAKELFSEEAQLRSMIRNCRATMRHSHLALVQTEEPAPEAEAELLPPPPPPDTPTEASEK